MYIDVSKKDRQAGKSSPPKKPDTIRDLLTDQAGKLFQTHKLPASRQEWASMKKTISECIIEKAGIQFYPELPFNQVITGRSRRMTYSIQNLYFQTLPGVYATANMYIPDGDGPFPAVINFHGHIIDSKLDQSVQNRAHMLAQNGFVCFCMDAFGTGERSVHPKGSDYHGGMEGASHFNHGQSLLGIQASENIRIVDLLHSFDFIDRNNIGATGESGGGNQAMWLAAIDDRIKAVMPVVSVGTFEAFIMAHNCVCETLPHGLQICEEAHVLGMIAPRGLYVCNALQEKHSAFATAEMIRTVTNTGKIYRLENAAENFQIQIFNNEHEYSGEMQQSMINWFINRLKAHQNQVTVNLKKATLSKEELCVFNYEPRNRKIITQPEYLRMTSERLLHRKEFKYGANTERAALKQILGLAEPWALDANGTQPAGGSHTIHLKSRSCQYPTPCSYLTRPDKPNNITICLDPRGKGAAFHELPAAHPSENLVAIELLGTGEFSSPTANFFDSETIPFHTISRSLLWMGRTVMGEWVNQIHLATQFAREMQAATSVQLVASREAAVAAILYAAIFQGVDKLLLSDAPLSYQYEEQHTSRAFNMSVILPGIIPWGDLVHAMALSDAEIHCIEPKNIHGTQLSDQQQATISERFNQIKAHYQTRATLNFQ
ncbi:acetylxylan esterase [Flavihumibacter sp. RY-1]|uniref:Acetylxylan esterase n=1 Tax=Flavihumibacter fluminis TaxID=2909236 RepID=A0ABS9BKV5_9BACT|nr:acetylxylan esterase [Flavihumibacter fluminis]MCF1715643.1 acetylxylan esterase [Flavihumibacter fluminis]